MEEDNKYHCKQCNCPASVDKDGKITRTCEHNTTIILDLEVIATGDGSFSN